jgi:hypothetical protein
VEGGEGFSITSESNKMNVWGCSSERVEVELEGLAIGEALAGVSMTAGK